MRWRTLRPVGEPLAPIRRGLNARELLPTGYEPYFVQSGTAALALALLVAKASMQNRRRVLLPAYGCPDLVAAVIYAGLEPVLVDTVQDLPFMDPDCLEVLLDEQVMAVIAAHFLGLAEDVATIRKLAQRVGAVVVEDSAQRLPRLAGTGPNSDLVVLSFGRGKPAGALGGGVLLVKAETHPGANPNKHIGPAQRERLPIGLSRRTYNIAIGPVPYSVLSRMSILRLGETRYQPLASIRQLSAGRQAAALSQLDYIGPEMLTSYPSRAESLRKCVESIPCLSGTTELAARAGPDPLVRFPLVMSSRSACDRTFESLNEAGLGVSRMYGASIPDIPGIPGLWPENFPRASDFAGRLLTLPLHSVVKSHDLERIVTCLSNGI